jgi:REP element-mobilizing transposase RayT
MQPPPIYTPENTRPVHKIRFDWTGWLKPGEEFPKTLPKAIDSCRHAWQADGLELIRWHTEDHRVQCLFNSNIDTPPTLCSSRAKGRLQNELRKHGTPVKFSRRVGMRCLGDNTREIVARYLDKQVGKSDYVDPRFKDYLNQFTVADPEALLNSPQRTAHGEYWYNLHLVIVVQDRRNPMTRDETFKQVGQTCFKIARKHDHQIAELAIMPDHIHCSLRGNHEQSPQEIGLCFLNNLAYVLGYNRCWSEEFYVGTFSEYSVKAITRKP